VLLHETDLESEVVITTEHGGINGLPKPLPAFGAHVNPEAILDPPSVFDMYDGGVIDATLLGLAQADAAGDVNVSMFGGRLMGCGGFIDITARTRNIFFCGTLTAGGSKTAICDGRLVIEQEGKNPKAGGRGGAADVQWPQRSAKRTESQDRHRARVIPAHRAWLGAH